MPSSACSLLSPSLLTCLHDFAHVPCRPNLENVAVFQGRMLRHELYGMIHVPRLKDENAAELFLGFRVGTVGGRDFAVLPVQGQRGFRRLERFSASPVPVGAKMVIVIKACVEHGVLFSRGHALEFAFVVVSETYVLHCFLLVLLLRVGASSTALSAGSFKISIVHPIVVAHRKNRQQRRPLLFQCLEPSGEKTALRFLQRQGSAFSYEAHASGIRPNVRQRSAPEGKRWDSPHIS